MISRMHPQNKCTNYRNWKLLFPAVMWQRDRTEVDVLRQSYHPFSWQRPHVINSDVTSRSSELLFPVKNL